jgi:DNA-directed RNA polymerase specialized sigma24 family protein
VKKSYQKRPSCRKSPIGAGNSVLTGCPPALNKSVKKALLAEIKQFDAKAAQKEADDSAKGRRSIDAYTSWVYFHGGHEPLEANLDVLSEDEGLRYFPSTEDSETADLLKDVRQLFSPRELQAWNLVMRHNMSYREAADLLDVSLSSVQNYVKRARIKFMKFMEAKKRG